ncbi:transposase [Candidatus Fermentibacterales bacterium]|nr:transposase [Candidatus Fermentibacterales bacterium]
MARIARVVLPGIPHHVTQRGVRSMSIFDSDDDRLFYVRSLRKAAAAHGLSYVCWCLMGNHVHLVVIPEAVDSLARGIGDAHKAYTATVNERKQVRGYLFQGRFYSTPLGTAHLVSAIRYAHQNPVRAGLVRRPTDYRWSSARYYAGLCHEDPLVGASLSDLGIAREAVRGALLGEEEESLIRRHTRTGRPLGDERFVRMAEKLTGRSLARRKPGPRARGEISDVSP